MPRDELLRALRNERIVQKRIFTDRGMFPGPEPAIELPAKSVIVVKDGGKIFITLEDLIKVVAGVLQPA